MQSRALAPLLLRSDRPSRLVGVLAAITGVALATAAVYPLKQVTPVVSLGVLYVLAVVVVSTFWGLFLGIATSILSAAAFNFFHLPPPGRFALADERDWAALVALVVVAVATGLVADAARSRGLEAERVGADVIYWSTIHAPSGEQRIGPTAAYLLSKRPCRVIIETENLKPSGRVPAAAGV